MTSFETLVLGASDPVGAATMRRQREAAILPARATKPRLITAVERKMPNGSPTEDFAIVLSPACESMDRNLIQIGRMEVVPVLITFAPGAAFADNPADGGDCRNHHHH